MLGWNPGSEQEIFSLEELARVFSIERVHKGGAKFDFEKAKWFNHQYIQQADNATLAGLVKPYFDLESGVGNRELGLLEKVVGLIKDRCALLPDFWAQGHFFFTTPEIKEMFVIKEKWNEQKQQFFTAWISELDNLPIWDHDTLEASCNELVSKYGLKKGDVMLPLRIMLVGGKYGPGVFAIAEVIGKEETIKRIKNVITWENEI
jgi:glutamyl-tRNA synthetase